MTSSSQVVQPSQNRAPFSLPGHAYVGRDANGLHSFRPVSSGFDQSGSLINPSLSPRPQSNLGLSQGGVRQYPGLEFTGRYNSQGKPIYRRVSHQPPPPQQFQGPYSPTFYPQNPVRPVTAQARAGQYPTATETAIPGLFTVKHSIGKTALAVKNPRGGYDHLIKGNDGKLTNLHDPSIVDRVNGYLANESAMHAYNPTANHPNITPEIAALFQKSAPQEIMIGPNKDKPTGIYKSNGNVYFKRTNKNSEGKDEHSYLNIRLHPDGSVWDYSGLTPRPLSKDNKDDYKDLRQLKAYYDSVNMDGKTGNAWNLAKKFRDNFGTLYPSPDSSQPKTEEGDGGEHSGGNGGSETDRPVAANPWCITPQESICNFYKRDKKGPSSISQVVDNFISSSSIVNGQSELSELLNESLNNINFKKHADLGKVNGFQLIVDEQTKEKKICGENNKKFGMKVSQSEDNKKTLLICPKTLFTMMANKLGAKKFSQLVENGLTEQEIKEFDFKEVLEGRVFRVEDLIGEGSELNNETKGCVFPPIAGATINDENYRYFFQLEKIVQIGKTYASHIRNRPAVQTLLRQKFVLNRLAKIFGPDRCSSEQGKNLIHHLVTKSRTYDELFGCGKSKEDKDDNLCSLNQKKAKKKKKPSKARDSDDDETERGGNEEGPASDDNRASNDTINGVSKAILTAMSKPTVRVVY